MSFPFSEIFRFISLGSGILTTLCFVVIAIFFLTANPSRVFSWFYLFGTIFSFLGSLTFLYINSQGLYLVGAILAVVGLFGIAWAYRRMSRHFNPSG